MRYQPVLHFGNTPVRIPVFFDSYLEARAIAIEICAAHPRTDTFSVEPEIKEEPDGNP